MKQYQRSFIVLGMWLVPTVVFAEEVAKQDTGNVLLTAVLTAVGAMLIAVAGWIGKLSGKFIGKKIEDIQNDMLQKAAYVAVRWVDDQYKKASGNEKFKLACERVAKKIPGISGEDIEESIAAMYRNYAAEMPKNVS